MAETALNPPPAAPEPKPSVQASFSVMLGILSLILAFLCVSLLAAVPAVILGHKALAQIKASNGAMTGRDAARLGLVLGYLGIVVGVLGLFMAVPEWVKMPELARQTRCIQNLQEINAAKGVWAADHQKKPGDVPASDELLPYLPGHRMPVCPEGGVYTIGAVSNPPTCSVSGHQLP